MGVISGESVSEACAMAASLQPQTKPPWATPPEWHICGPTAYSITDRPASELTTRTCPRVVWRVGAIASVISAVSGLWRTGSALRAPGRPATAAQASIDQGG